jgi:hypothetical protein
MANPTPTPPEPVEQQHIARLELEEIADGAYGNDPRHRGLARDALAESTLPEPVAEVLGRALKQYQNALLAFAADLGAGRYSGATASARAGLLASSLDEPLRQAAAKARASEGNTRERSFDAAQYAFDQQTDHPQFGDWNDACRHIAEGIRASEGEAK